MRLLMVTQVVDLNDPILGFTQSWINGLAQHVDHLHVLARLAGQRQLAPNVALHAYAAVGQRDVPLSRHAFFHRTFAKLIMANQVDAVFIHMIPKWVLMVAPYAKLRRLPVVFWYTHRAISWQLRLAHRLAHRIVTASPASYPLWDERKVVALGHGIDTSHFRPAFRQPDGVFRVLSVGRLSLVKQHEVLIEATRLLAQERGMDNLQVRIVGGPALGGDEAYASRLRQMVAGYGLQGRIIFVGPLSYQDVIQEYQACDLFINLSRTGSLDKAVLEAMACELPIVTSNPAFASLLSDMKEELLVPQGQAQALAKTIKQVMGMAPEHRQALGLALRESVKREHEVAPLMERLIALLRDLGENM